jgi:hypothetical protein
MFTKQFNPDFDHDHDVSTGARIAAIIQREIGKPLRECIPLRKEIEQGQEEIPLALQALGVPEASEEAPSLADCRPHFQAEAGLAAQREGLSWNDLGRVGPPMRAGIEIRGSGPGPGGAEIGDGELTPSQCATTTTTSAR